MGPLTRLRAARPSSRGATPCTSKNPWKWQRHTFFETTDTNATASRFWGSGSSFITWPYVWACERTIKFLVVSCPTVQKWILLKLWHTRPWQESCWTIVRFLSKATVHYLVHKMTGLHANGHLQCIPSFKQELCVMQCAWFLNEANFRLRRRHGFYRDCDHYNLFPGTQHENFSY